MRDPDQGVREMRRVTRAGGTVAACMWDIAGGGMTMLRLFWSAVRQVVPGVEGERRRVGTAEGDIAERFTHAGLEDVVGGALSARADYTGFDDFWDPFMLGVGPSGQYLRTSAAQSSLTVNSRSTRGLGTRVALCRPRTPPDLNRQT